MAVGRGAGFWQGHIEAWSRSGQTQAAYCGTHGLSRKSFYRWRGMVKQAMTKAPPKTLLTLVPVGVAEPVRDGAVRLYSPGGWKVELPAGDTSWLAGLLKQLP